MKKHSFSMISGILLLLIAFAFTCFTHASGKASKHPPGICSVAYGAHSDLQKASDVVADFLNSAVIYDEQWEPKTTFVGYISSVPGKALPKTARQRLYGLQDGNYYNKIC
jgi:hypothetical protein